MDIWTRSRRILPTSTDLIYQNEMLDEYMRLGAGGSPKSETIEMLREDYDFVMNLAISKGLTFTQVIDRYIIPLANQIINQS